MEISSDYKGRWWWWWHVSNENRAKGKVKESQNRKSKTVILKAKRLSFPKTKQCPLFVHRCVCQRKRNLLGCLGSTEFLKASEVPKCVQGL